MALALLPTGCAETAELFDLGEARGRPAVTLSDVAVSRDHQLLATLIGQNHSAPEKIAKALLTRFRDWHSLFCATADQLFQVPTMNSATAAVILAHQELSVRRARADIGKRPVISSWTALLAYVKVAMAGASREQFRVIFLDRKNQLISDEVLNHGTVDHAPVYPREVIRRCLELDASSIILAHNHPSGDPTPSSADVEMTRQVVAAGQPLRIAVHDHVIVGRDGVSSLKALGLF